MKRFINTVETWVRKGSQVALIRFGWIGKPLALVCGVVVVGALILGGFYALAWVVADGTRIVLATLAVTCVIPWESVLPFWGAVVGLVLVGEILPPLLQLLPTLVTVWILIIVLQCFQGPGRRSS